MRKKPDYLDFIREQPCTICGNLNSHAHHWRTVSNSGIGLKPPDLEAIPLCYDHHTGPQGIHNLGVQTWADRFLSIKLPTGYLHDDVKYAIMIPLWHKYIEHLEEIAVSLRANLDTITINRCKCKGGD